jgi:hypothetical protein
MLFKFIVLSAAGFASAAISNVEGTWENNKHPGNSRGGVWFCATHAGTIASGAANKITYQFPADEIIVPAGNVQGTDYTWHTAANVAAAKLAAAVTTAVCTHTATGAVGTVECHTLAVATATHVSCVLMKKAYPVKQTITHANIKVKSTAAGDTAFAPSSTALTTFTAAFTAVTLTAPTADAAIGSAESTLKISFTPNAAITTSNKVTVSAPGYTFGKGAQCGFGTLTKSTATTAASVGYITFTPGAASGTAATYVECTKFSATTKTASPKFSVWVGTSDATTAIQGEFVAGKSVTTKAPTAFSAASQVSYNALFVGALVAASVFLL